MQLEKDRKGSLDEVKSTKGTVPNRWNRIQSKLWKILNKPNSSLMAKVCIYQQARIKSMNMAGVEISESLTC